ncbi:phosphatidylserine decarboxylase [Sphingomonas panacisoli]|uniref:Phosphatidylserine decarboxylase proenzyme n=1 Tax=Sphingomonas panacisoli TaxID=1813879 RepID=A0A5B8LGX7_9SPHN|nr:phosphatidylserine decarboxylase [Sphingomonas panacisoli]QDZ07507.1 phosphatidylserine decarboxylase [Sphingomonas panacisoli]
MPSIDPPETAQPTVKWHFPAMHPEGRRYVIIVAVAAVLSLLIWNVLFWPLAFLALGVAAFFRDPIRVTPKNDGLVVAPADGLITMIQPVMPPPELAILGTTPLIRVSIFMSVFDVHVNRTPIAGTIRQVVYISGKFLNADLDKASEENERQHIVVEGKDGRLIGFTQIAGLVARRIVAFVKEGDMLAVGQRVGLIRFGSRVDVFLPADTVPQVVLGQRAIAGETVLGKIGGEAMSGITQ